MGAPCWSGAVNVRGVVTRSGCEGRCGEARAGAACVERGWSEEAVTEA